MEKIQDKIKMDANVFASSAIILDKIANAGIYNDNFTQLNKVVIAHTIIPAIVLKAFSCELYMKSLITNSNIKKIHKLDELFMCLNKEDKDNIQEIIICVLSKNNFYNIDAFNEDLKKVANAFVDWRYFYENPEININLEFLNVLFETLGMYVRQK